MKTFVDWMARRQSRRGFIAMLGKGMLGIGFAMAGVSLNALRVGAACCMGASCNGCLAPGCPAGCIHQSTNRCCDTGTNTYHDCYVCYCGTPMQPSPCECEFDLGIPCP